MVFLLRHFFRRLIREGAKSLVVPLLAFVLVVLINLLGGIKVWLEEDFEDTMSNFPVVAKLSNITGSMTDGLYISDKYIEIFTQADAPLSLQAYTGALTLKRTMNIVDEAGLPTGTVLVGITDAGADDDIDPETGAIITFFEDYDERILNTNELVCLISEDILAQNRDGVLRAVVKSIYRPDGPGGKPASLYGKIEIELTIVGTVSGSVGDRVYAPFWTVSALGMESDELPYHSERLYAMVGDNRALSTFKSIASLSFPKVAPIYDSRPFSMMIYDSAFYETLEPIRQNMIVIEVATPFLYIISVCVGFLTSILMTRRRKPEFALMRCAGIHRRDIFIGTLAEQIVLSLTGAALGCILVAATWGYFSAAKPTVFLACYVLGTLFSSIRAAGTNVLKILHERE